MHYEERTPVRTDSSLPKRSRHSDRRRRIRASGGRIARGRPAKSDGESRRLVLHARQGGPRPTSASSQRRSSQRPRLLSVRDEDRQREHGRKRRSLQRPRADRVSHSLRSQTVSKTNIGELGL